MEGFVLLALIAFGVWHFWARRQWRFIRAKNAVQKLQGFWPAHAFVSTDGCAIAIDPRAKKIAFVDLAGRPSIYAFSDILHVEVCKEGISFTKTNRRSQIFWMAIGQWFFGSKGFVVGGDTASQTTAQQVTALSMKVYLADYAQPLREIDFYRGQAIEVNGQNFKRQLGLLDEWHGRLRMAIANP